MTREDSERESTIVAPEEAFAVLGDETRLSILHTLGEADEPLAFNELRDRVGYDTAGNFSYHIEKLAGHFVEKTNAGYDLRQAGRRVVEAALSGAVTEAPVLEPTEVDQTCQFCGAPVEVSFREEQVTVACTECAGVYGESAGAGDRQRLGTLSLPPAAVLDRTASEVLQAAYTWGGLEVLGIASGVCPRCGAPVDESVDVCPDHDAIDGLCEACDARYSVHFSTRCTNCIYAQSGALGIGLVANTDLLAFLTTHGINPISPSSQSAWGAALGDYEEEVLSREPFEARITFTIAGDSLTLTVDDDLSVVEATRSRDYASG